MGDGDLHCDDCDHADPEGVSVFAEEAIGFVGDSDAVSDDDSMLMLVLSVSAYVQRKTYANPNMKTA